MFGTWTLADFKGVKLPQEVATGFVAVTSELVGAEYQPVLYIGNQVVKGTNYCVLALQTIRGKQRFVKVIFNLDLDGEYSLISISGVNL